MAGLLTQEQFVRVLPKKLHTQISSELVDQINTTISDPILMEAYRDNLLSYTNVMTDGKFKMHSYLDAVRYVSCKLFGSSNIEAYTKTFPDRYQRFITNNTSQKDIASYVTAYNKTKLVNLIFEQTLIPTHILNADLYQSALNTQAELMLSASSEKVRTDAANSLLTHLRMPDTNKIELDITVKEDSAIADLRASTMKLVGAQKAAISSGAASARQIAHSKLEIAEEVIEGEAMEIVSGPPVTKKEEEDFELFGGFSNA